MNKENVKEFFKDYYPALIVGAFMLALITCIGVLLYHATIQPKEGVVIRKDYYPEHTTTTYETISSSNGKTTTTTRIPIQQYHPARYQITIKGINSKGEEDFGYYDVTPAEYESIKVGDYYIKQQG